MKCPVCKTECGGAVACPECGFEYLNPTFLSKEEGEAWIENVVWPWRRKYWESLGDFEINGTTLIKYLGNEKIVIIPYGIETIDTYSFLNRKSIHEIHFPNTLRIINHEAFYSCENLESVVLPEGVVEIGGCAFQHCSNLLSVHLPASLSKIGIGAFSTCRKLECFEINKDNQRFKYMNRCLIDIENSTIVSGQSIDSIPSDRNIKIIGAIAFDGCTWDHEEDVLIIPGNIEEIQDFAFSDIDGLSRVWISESVVEIGDYAFEFREQCTLFCEAKRKPPLWSDQWCSKRDFISAIGEQLRDHHVCWDKDVFDVMSEYCLVPLVGGDQDEDKDYTVIDDNNISVILTDCILDLEADSLKFVFKISCHAGNPPAQIWIDNLMIDDKPCNECDGVFAAIWGMTEESTRSFTIYNTDNNALFRNAKWISFSARYEDDTYTVHGNRVLIMGLGIFNDAQ